VPVLAVVHPDAQLRLALKRGIVRPHLRLITCRTTRRVSDLISKEVVDAVVTDVKARSPEWFFQLLDDYPGIPGFAFSPFRPDDGRLMMSCLGAGVDTLLFQGVDEPIAGELVSRRCAGARLEETLTDAPRLLRLRDPLQLNVWQELFTRVDTRMRTADIARTLGVSREHLSREFAAGGAPNLKRVIDLVRLIRAADMLKNPGYSVADVAAILDFASASHLSSSARRLADETPRKLAQLGPRGILARFLGGRTRSRL
jgi:AraC-like DNA-binding protein